jgi:hypothetical protein
MACLRLSMLLCQTPGHELLNHHLVLTNGNAFELCVLGGDCERICRPTWDLLRVVASHRSSKDVGSVFLNVHALKII